MNIIDEITVLPDMRGVDLLDPHEPPEPMTKNEKRVSAGRHTISVGTQEEEAGPVTIRIVACMPQEDLGSLGELLYEGDLLLSKGELEIGSYTGDDTKIVKFPSKPLHVTVWGRPYPDPHTITLAYSE